jgi:hypothetical protein
MTAEEIAHQLQRIALDDDFPFRSQELTDAWEVGGVDIAAVEPVLLFMERHPHIDYGSPGPLVHFVERFDGPGYEDRLLESIRRTPTPHTIWMLHRLINGAANPDRKRKLIDEMQRARRNPASDARAIESIDLFLQP